MDDVIIKDEDGNTVDFLSQNWKLNDLIFFLTDIVRTYTTATLDVPSFVNSDTSFQVCPNPVKDIVHIEIDLRYQSNLQIELVSTYGQIVFQSKSTNYTSGHQKIMLSKADFNVVPGMYLCIINAGKNGKFVKKIILN